MKNLSLFVTLSLLTLMGTCTTVKAEDNLLQSQDPNSVILSQEMTEDMTVTDEEPGTEDMTVTDEEPGTEDMTVIDDGTTLEKN